MSLTVTYIGGPTALLEFGSLRFLTDPTFDAAGGTYRSGPVTLSKLSGPALSLEQVGAFDYVLLSHDHHFDNLDHAGRGALKNARAVFTTDEGARRLGCNSAGLTTWQMVEVPTPGAGILQIVATPARHGPEGLSRGAVTGFALSMKDAPERAVYISGDTVWYQGVTEVARRFAIRAAVLNLGAASVPEVGPFHLTMTASEAVQAAHAFRGASIIPLHFEGWAHFREGRPEITREFASAGLEDRLRWPEAGRPMLIDLG